MEKSLYMCSMMLVWVCLGVKLTGGQGGTLGFYLDGVRYPDGSTVLRTDIGTGADALLCTTDREGCCNVIPNRDGEFYFPNNTRVPTLGGVGSSGYYRDRGFQLIRLNRQSENGVVTGRFRCEIPSGTITDSVLLINIVDISVSITPSGDSDNTAGQIYILNCTISISGSADQPTILWLGGGAEIDFAADAARTVSTTSGSDGSYSSTLTFNPLAVSHAGTYTCRATLGGVKVNESTEIFIKATPMTTTEAPTSETTTTTEALLPTTVAPTAAVPSSTIVALTSEALPSEVPTTEASTEIASTQTTEAPTPTTTMPSSEGPTAIVPSPTTIAPVSEISTTTEASATTIMPLSPTEASTAAVPSPTPDAPTTMIPTSDVPTTKEPPTPSVYLSLKGVIFANNSLIHITEIGETTDSVQCVTDRRPCCAAIEGRAGEWYFPDGTRVPVIGSGATMATTFYRNRGDDGTVNLNRLNNVIMPTGLFCCEVPDTAGADQTLCAEIVNVVAMITPTDTPTAGETYSLDCSVSGIDDPATYQWFDSNRTQLSNTSELRFSPLRASEGGDYTCQAAVRSIVIEETITVNVNLPAPTAVTVTPPAGMIIAGSRSSSLTCTIELNPAVDIPVTVTTEWSGPERTMFLPDKLVSAVMVNTTTYTSTVTIDAARSGNYSCQATVSSGGTTSGSINITVAPLPPPTILTASSPTATSITLTWEQSEGADAVDGYMLYYEYTVRQCSGDEGDFPPVSTRIADGSLREYTIENSSDTPVEEDSQYSTITLRAINTVNMSEPSNSVSATTGTATPRPPPSLAASSVSISSITIQWDPIPCQDQNHPFNNYAVNSFPSSNPSVMGDEDLVPVTNRVYTASNLSPRTSYTFQVQALSLFPLVQGVLANLTVKTSAPTNLGFLLDGQLYGNNSVVTVTDIGSSFFMSALFCLTPSLECCSDSETPNAASVTREWYLPDDRPVASAGTVFSREQVSSAVALYRSGGTSPSGVFRCGIPDASGTSQNIYIGIYPQGDGSPAITSLLFDRNSTTLTCTSTGGPPTTVTWRKDGRPINETLYQRSQRLVDAERATYENVLFNSNVANFVGSFTCEVSNVRGRGEEIVELNGVSIVRDPFNVGELATATCSSDTPATSIEWLRNGEVVASAASTQMLVLMVSLVNDSIHGQVYVCRVTREGGVVAMQNFTVQVNVPSGAIKVSIERSGVSIAGEMYTLTCNVSAISGLMNSPSAVWTDGAMSITNESNVTVLTTVGNSYSISVLTFNPLRTSHGDDYTCRGAIDSPALNLPQAISVQETVTVQISTPAINITVPSGPLYAGTLSLTLTCTIYLNPATDSDVRLADMDVTWLRGDVPLQTGGRENISALEGSRPTFTSQLTLTPLSTEDTAFACQAVARPPLGPGFITMSGIGKQTVNVPIEIPPAPSVSIVSSGPSTAGMPHNLTCSATVIPGLAFAPSLRWAGPGVGQPGVEVSGEGPSGPLSLSFSSLLTNQSGVYTCTAMLSVPRTTVRGTNTTILVVQIPPRPDLVVNTGSPLNEGFFVGLDLTFTCSITLDSAVNTPVAVQGTWNRNGTNLTDDGNRITVMSVPMSMPPYTTIVRLNPLIVNDTGTYTCVVTVTPENDTYVTGTTYAVSRNISIGGFPVQVVAPITTEGSSTAGLSGYTLICNVSKNQFLSASATLAVQWLDLNDAISEGNPNFTVSDIGPTTNTVLTSRLTFNSLYTSQAGEYSCRTLLTIHGTVDNHAIDQTFTVVVKLPTPESIRIELSRGTPLYEGTTFSLTCTITPNRTGVDTGFMVTVPTFSGPGAPMPSGVTMTTDMDFQIILSFTSSNPLAMSNAGTFTCSAIVVSAQVPNVDPSDANMTEVEVNVTSLPPPDVNIEAGPPPLAGQSHTLSCFASTQDHVVVVPVLNWESVGARSGVLEGQQMDTSNTAARRSLTFNPVRSSHAGQYTCRARTVIPQASINLNSSAEQNVSVRVSILNVGVPSPPENPYNGTNFTVIGEVELDPSVDTGVTVIGTWSGDATPQETSVPPYRILLPFLPATTNSSGEYILTISVRPMDNFPLIISNSDTATYNLAVKPLPSRPPNISIVSRRQLDGCGEVMTLNCTATQIENLFSPPTIVWIAPGGSEVPTVESSNPRMNPQTRELIFSDITTSNRGLYTCRSVVNIPEAQIDNYTFGTDTVQVNTVFPGEVGNLVCAVSSSPSELSFSWDVPTRLGSEVVSYQVIVNRLEHRPGTREVIQSAVDEQFVESLDARVTGLDAEVPYNITVKALNLAGCGEENQTYCFTREGVPPQPTNVVVTRVDDTTMMVTWDELTLVELKGLANYTITYSLGGGSRKRQAEGMVTVPWTENSVTIGNLQSGAAYSVSVGTITSAGMSNRRAGGTLEAVSNDPAAIVGGIIAAILFAILVILVVIIVLYVVRRRRVSKFSPGHMYDTGAKASTEERELQPLDNGSSQPAISEKEKEALEESAIVPPPTQPRSAITTEVLDRMKPVSQASFRDHVAEKHEDRDKGFEAEYQSFGTDPVNSHEIAKLPINRPKNRFANIFPYDHSRVKLNTLPGEEGSDYINACSLDGYKRQGCYIAAQGPMPNTISDFWRMIWEKRLPNIVMLTKCLEAGRRKCEQYWADNIGEDYQTPDKKLNITTTSVMPYADFSIRTFSIKSLTDASLDPLSVTQYHFTSWPDHGVPKFATSLISFIRRVQRGHTKDSGRQLLVHCSAGVGRTGTLITLDSMLDRMAAKEPDVNVYEFVYNMRQRRVLMVQTLAQYVFIHDALNELITCGQTDIVASALRTKVNFLSKVIPAKGITGFQNQFQLLEQVSRLPADEDLTDAMETYNRSKNRYPDKIPYNMSRARLRPTGEDGSEYINASFIDGYKQRNAYIATQGPLQSTVNDIWRMLYEFKSRTLVMLCNMNEDGGEASYPFFPSKEEEPVKYGKMLVTLQSKASYTDFIVRKFSIQEDKGSPKNDGFVVTQFHLTEWPPHQVPNTGTLIEMLDMVTKNQMSTGNRPITVMCNDGVGRTGTFICIHAQLERLKTEGVVDFFQSIKSARIQRAGLVPDVDQYAFCHTVLADYIDKFDNYANFKDMVM